VGAALVHFGLGTYTVATVLYLSWLVRPSERMALLGRAALGVGLLCHLGALGLAIAANPDQPPWRDGHLFSMLAAATVLTYLALDWRYGLPVAGSFVAPLTIAATVPAHLSGGPGSPGPLPLPGTLLPLHVAFATLGSVALLLAFVLAVLYLVSERQLKRKHPGRLFARLPSLDLVDRLGWQLTIWGFVLLSVVIVTGAFVTRAERGGMLRLDAKSAFALLAWALLASSIQARLVAGWRGRRIAILVVVGFVLLLFSFVGLLVRSPLGVGKKASAERTAGLQPQGRG
jgi:ABC-type uncharacterized transport system permease subunit